VSEKKVGELGELGELRENRELINFGYKAQEIPPKISFTPQRKEKLLHKPSASCLLPPASCLLPSAFKVLVLSRYP